MFNNLKLFGMLLAIPLVGYVALGLVNSDQEHEWRQALERNYKDVPEDRLIMFALDKVCEDTALASKLDATCSTFFKVRLIQRAALWGGIASVCFAVLVMLSGAVCKANRNLLLLSFAPGLYISNAFISLLVVIQSIVLTGTLYYGGSAWLGEDWQILLFALVVGFLTLLGAWAIIKAMFRLVRKANTVVIGHSLTEAQHPKLWHYVKDLAKQTGTEPPHNLVVGLTPNFFVTEADVRCLDGELTGRTMYISVPLCRILTLEQLTGIIAHELAHFKGADTKFSLGFYPIYRGAIDSLNDVTELAFGEKQALTLIPAICMLAFFLERFSSAENRISRDRELAADAIGAEIAGAANIAVGLVKIVAFTGLWDRLTVLMKDSLRKGTIIVDETQYDAQRFFSNVSNVFAHIVANNAKPDALLGLDAKTLPHLPTHIHR